MAYFSNGTDGMDYESRYCDNCANNREHPGEPMGDLPSCPIWDLHQEYNYGQCKKGKTASVIKMFLETLIPTKKNGFAGECSMFLDKAAQTDKQKEYLEQLRFGQPPALGMPDD